MVPVVIDTNVFVAGLRSGGGASRQVLRRALDGVYLPLFSNALWLEYEDVLGRSIWTGETSPGDRVQVLAALAAAGRWVKIYYGWRPNLRDPGITIWSNWPWPAARRRWSLTTCATYVAPNLIGPVS